MRAAGGPAGAALAAPPRGAEPGRWPRAEGGRDVEEATLPDAKLLEHEQKRQEVLELHAQDVAELVDVPVLMRLDFTTAPFVSHMVQEDFDELGYPRVPKHWNEEWLREQMEAEMVDPRVNPNLLIDCDHPEFWNSAARKPYARAMLRSEQHWTNRRNAWLRQWEKVEVMNGHRGEIAELLEDCSTEVKRLLMPILKFKVVEFTLLQFLDDARDRQIQFREVLQHPGNIEYLQKLRQRIDCGDLLEPEAMLKEYAANSDRILEEHRLKEEAAARGKRFVLDTDSMARALNHAEKCRKDGYIEWYKGNTGEALASWREADKQLRRWKLADSDPAGNKVVADVHSAVLKNIAQAAIRLALWTEAVAAADEALRIDCEDHKAWFRRACALEGLGRCGEALDALVKVEDCAVGRSDRDRIQLDVASRRSKVQSRLDEDRQLTRRTFAMALELGVFGEDRDAGESSAAALTRALPAPRPLSPSRSDLLGASGDRPGPYVVTRETTVRGSVAISSSKVGDLPVGAEIQVLEVVLRKAEHRVRGRIEEPAGWITLLDMRRQTRWAERRQSDEELLQAKAEKEARTDGQLLRHETRRRLTKDGAAELLEELRRAYSETSFQQQVAKLSEDMRQDKSGFMRNMRKVTLPVQQPLLEKWGFEPSVRGATEMQLAVQDHVRGSPPSRDGGDVVLQAKAAEVTKLLYGEMYEVIFAEVLALPPPPRPVEGRPLREQLLRSVDCGAREPERSASDE